MTKVEQFEVIRRKHFIEKKGIRKISRELGVHRRKVKQALESAVPPVRAASRRLPSVLTPEIREVVDGWLRMDLTVRRKQRHTAHRIYERLRVECGYDGAESTVRGFVADRRRHLGLSGEMFVPQSPVPGQEAEVDWYEADVDFPDGRRKVNILEIRACASGREFHIAYPRATQQAFLEGLFASFDWFEGIFPVYRFDNLRSAVKKVLKGRQRKEADLFVAFRSHFLFEAVFCRVGEVGAHEKGGVEGGVGRFRRNALVPVPKVRDYTELNNYLLEQCVENDQRTIHGRDRTILEDWGLEVPGLQPLPVDQFSTEAVSRNRIDSKSRVTVCRNHYSVPTTIGHGRLVEVRVGAKEVVVIRNGKEVARHDRLYGIGKQSLNLDHYLELLRYKPGALSGSTPLKQSRERGEWPAVYDELWKALQARHGEAAGTQEMVEILLSHRDLSKETIEKAIREALDCGAASAAAVQMLARRPSYTTTTTPFDHFEELAQYGTPVRTDLSAYDDLIGRKDDDDDEDGNTGGPIGALQTVATSIGCGEGSESVGGSDAPAGLDDRIPDRDSASRTTGSSDSPGGEEAEGSEFSDSQDSGGVRLQSSLSSAGSTTPDSVEREVHR